VILGVNPRGPADRCVPVLRVEDETGKLTAVLFGCACHNTTLGPSNYAICGDYAGFAQATIEQRQPGVIALFAIGCGGDANPYPRNTMEAAKQNGKDLGDEVCRVLESKKAHTDHRPAHHRLRSRRSADEKCDPRGTRQTRRKKSRLANGQRQNHARHARSRPSTPHHLRAPVALWQFGQSLTIVAMSGEVVVDYVHSVEKAIGPLNLWPMGYGNDYFGYLPSARVLEEGGYETRGLNSGQGWFSPAAEARWSASKRTSNESSKPLP